MFRPVILRTGAVLLLVLAVSGCANKKLDERISLLEDTNMNLTGQLNRAMGELDAMSREREALDGRLLATQREADDLRNQLANVPVPEEAAPGWTAVPGGAMIAVEGSVLFAPGKVTLRDQARRTLDRIVSTIQGEYGGKDILVFGHTDDRPIKKSGWEDNWQLSTERALAVVRHIIGQGTSPNRVAACGCGEHRPRVPNSSEGNRSKNRRVEIFAIEPQPRTGRP